MSEKVKNTVIYVANEDCLPSDPSESEKTLLIAVLEGAIDDLGKQGFEAKEAKRFFLNPDEEYLFSFKSICEHLNIPEKQVLILTGLTQDPEFMTSYKRLNSSVANKKTIS